MLYSPPVDALVGVGAEAVALGLDQIGRKPVVPSAVEESEGAGKRRRRDPHGYRAGDLEGAAQTGYALAGAVTRR